MVRADGSRARVSVYDLDPSDGVAIGGVEGQMIMHILHNPFLWVTITGYLLASAASLLPPPTIKDGRGYLVLYRGMHLLAANWDKVSVVIEEQMEKEEASAEVRSEARSLGAAAEARELATPDAHPSRDADTHLETFRSWNHPPVPPPTERFKKGG